MAHRLVVIEALGGAGKTAVRKHLFSRLTDHSTSVLTVNEISWLTAASARVLTRARYHGEPMPPEDVRAAYIADKRDLTRRLIEPHLTVRHVLADRYVASDLAYQWALWHLRPDDGLDAYTRAGIRMPDLTVFLDRPVGDLLERLRAKPAESRGWWETEAHLGRLKDAFDLLLGAGDPRFAVLGDVVRLDARQPLERLLEQVDHHVVPRITELTAQPSAGPAN